MHRGKKKKKFCLIIKIAKVTMKAPSAKYWNLFENAMLDSTLWQEQQEGTQESLAPFFLQRKQSLVLQICKYRCSWYFLSTSEIKMEKIFLQCQPLLIVPLCLSMRFSGKAPLLSSLSFWNGKVLSLAAWTLPSAARCRCQSDSLWEHFIIP